MWQAGLRTSRAEARARLLDYVVERPTRTWRARGARPGKPRRRAAGASSRTPQDSLNSHTDSGSRDLRGSVVVGT